MARIQSLSIIIKFDKKPHNKSLVPYSLSKIHIDASNKAITVLEETASQLKVKILLSTSQIADDMDKRLEIILESLKMNFHVKILIIFIKSNFL